MTVSPEESERTQSGLGRWGADDEVGALNLVGSTNICGAARLVTRGQVLPLAMPLGPRTPMSRHRKRPERYMVRDGGDYAAGARRPDGFQFAEDVVSFSTHSGTHIDALCHAWSEDTLYNGHSAASIRSTTGAQRCGVDKIPPIVARGVVLDLEQDPQHYDESRSIGAEDLIRAARTANVDIQEGDVVLLHTGWMELAGHDEDRYFASEPGVDISGARWLAQHGVVAVGADNYAIEAQPSQPHTSFPVHQYLLRDCGIPLIENMVLDELAETGAAAFLFVAAPLPLVGSTASPLAPVAVI